MNVAQDETISPEYLKQEILERQREMNELNDIPVRQLEEKIKEKERELDEERQAYNELKADFEYNFKVIEQRDQEIYQKETQILMLQKVITEKLDQYISELKQSIVELQNKLKHEQSLNDEIELQYQERIHELEQEQQISKREFVEILGKKEEEFETIFRDLRNKLREKEETLQNQRRELESQFDEIIRKNNEEFKNKLFALTEKLESRDNIIAQLKNEKALLQHEKQALFEKMKKDYEEQLMIQEKEIMKLAEQLNSTKAESETKIKMYMDELQVLREKVKMLESQGEKEINLIKSQQENHLQEIKTTYENRINELTTALHSMTQQCETLKQQCKDMEWKLEDERRGMKNIEMEKMKLLKESEDKTTQLWAIQSENKTLHEKIEKLKRTIDEKTNALMNMQSLAEEQSKQIQSLERKLLQKELEFEQKIDLEKLKIGKEKEELLKSLMKERDELLTKLQFKTQRLEEVTNKVRQMDKEEYPKWKDREQMNQKTEKTSTPRSQLSQFTIPPPVDLNDLDIHLNDEVGQNKCEECENKQQQLDQALSKYSEVEVIVNQMSDAMQKTQKKLMEAEQELRSKEKQIQSLQKQLEDLKQGNNPTLPNTVDGDTMRKLNENVNHLTYAFQHFSQQPISQSSYPNSFEQITRLNTSIIELQHELNKQKNKLVQSESQVHVMGRENKNLKNKLKDATKDLKRLIKERDKLLEISNMLRAELQQCKQGMNHAKCHEIQQQLEAKVIRLQQKIKELTQQNEILEMEVKRLTERIAENRNTLSPILEKCNGRRLSTSSSFDHSLHEEIINSDFMKSKNDFSKDEKKDETVYPTKSSMERLNINTESLTLSGQPAITTERPKKDKISDKATTSQRKSLKKFQKTKAKLLSERKTLRKTK